MNGHIVLIGHTSTFLSSLQMLKALQLKILKSQNVYYANLLVKVVQLCSEIPEHISAIFKEKSYYARILFKASLLL